MLSRRSFILGALAAPAIVRAESIWVPPKRELITIIDYYRVINNGTRNLIIELCAEHNKLFDDIPFKESF